MALSENLHLTDIIDMEFFFSDVILFFQFSLNTLKNVLENNCTVQ